MSDVAPDDFSPEIPQAQSGLGQTLGARLKAEREARGWGAEYVAGQLNLAVRQIQALEADNYAALPGLASIRGFVRAYAKLLRVDADSFVALIASEQVAPNQPLEPKPNLSSTPFSHSRLSGGTGRGNSFKGAILALIVVLIAAAAIGIEHLGGWPTLSQSLSSQFKDLSSGSGSAASEDDGAAAKLAQEAAAPAENVSSAPSAQSDASPSQNPSSAPAAGTSAAPVTDAPASVPAVPQATTPAAHAAAPAATPAKPEPAKNDVAKNDAATNKLVPAQAGNAAAPKTSGAAGTLVLSARQNSWIDLRAGSNVVASHLLKAGDTETIEVPGPAQLTVGNAAAVTATFRGQPLSTATDGKSTVAHISLK